MARPHWLQRAAPAVVWLRASLRSKRLWRTAFIAAAVGFLAMVYEAAFRARLSPPAGRVPTALYSRSVPWNSEARRAEPVWIGAVAGDAREYRIPYRIEDIPKQLIGAVLAVEDQRFYEHHGLDFRRIAGAAVANLRSGSIRQGGSTITQQLAKNLFLSSRRTPLRKLREAVMAAALEDRYDKAAILEAYLNEVYLGQDGGDAIHGFGAAARYYFGRELDELSLGQSAMLAGIIRAPNYYNPARHPERAEARRDLVLDLMEEQERVSERDARRARRERVSARPHPRLAVTAPWFRDFVLASARRQLPSRAARGEAVYTTLDVRLQRAANRAVGEGLERLRRPEAQAALVALDPRSGDLLAMVGGREYGASQFNRAANAWRQPGSAFKPIVALAALGRDGRSEPRFTLASVIEDEPLRVNTGAGPWVPANYDGEFRGAVTFREAMEQSLNVPFARIGLAVGPERIVATARTLGLTGPLRAVPSIALGASEVTPLELTRAFGVLAAGGQRAELRTVLGVAGRDGTVRSAEQPRLEQVADAAEAYLVTSALEGVVTRGTGRGLEGVGGWGGLAGKSGTSNDWRDGWFLAYTPSLVVGVWVGYDDNRSLGLSGARAALPIVSRFLREALDGREAEQFRVPEGIELGWAEERTNDWWGGNGWGCSGRREVFLEGTAPEQRCRSYEWPEQWGRRLDRRTEALIELLQEHGEDLVRRLLERMADRSGRERP